MEGSQSGFDRTGPRGADLYGCGEDHRNSARARGVEGQRGRDRDRRGRRHILLRCCAGRAPKPILREASIRLAGWLYGNRPHVAEHEITDPSGTTIKLRFNNSAATANGWRASGASALLSRYVVRRGGVIS